MLVRRLWQLSEAGEPALLLGKPVDKPDRALFERLLERGVLRHAGQLTTWNPCNGCDCGRDERPIRWYDDRPVAVCVADRSQDLVLSPTDVITFELRIPELVAATAIDSGFAASPEEVSPGLWKLGQTPDNWVLHLVPTREALLRPGLIGSLRQTEPTRDMLILGPSLDRPSQANLVAQGIRSVPIVDIVSLSTPAPLALDLASLIGGEVNRVRLLLRAADKSIAFDGETCTLPATHFALLHLLAKRLAAGRPIVPAPEIQAALFSPMTSDARARDLVRELRRALREKLGVSELIETRSNLGYALALEAKAVSFRP